MLKLLDELKSYHSDQAVFNPWKDYSEQLDIGPNAPKIRTTHLQQYLEQRLAKARYILSQKH